MAAFEEVYVGLESLHAYDAVGELEEGGGVGVLG